MKLARISKVAKLCSVDRETIRRWVKERDFPSHQIGKKERRFDLVEVLRWFAEHDQKAPEALRLATHEQPGAS